MESLNWASFRVKSTSFDARLRLIREPLESPKIDLETDESEATDSESKLPEFDSFDSGLIRKIQEIRLQISAVLEKLVQLRVIFEAEFYEFQEQIGSRIRRILSFRVRGIQPLIRQFRRFCWSDSRIQILLCLQ